VGLSGYIDHRLQHDFSSYLHLGGQKPELLAISGNTLSTPL